MASRIYKTIKNLPPQGESLIIFSNDFTQAIAATVDQYVDSKTKLAIFSADGSAFYPRMFLFNPKEYSYWTTLNEWEKIITESPIKDIRKYTKNKHAAYKEDHLFLHKSTLEIVKGEVVDNITAAPNFYFYYKLPGTRNRDFRHKDIDEFNYCIEDREFNKICLSFSGQHINYDRFDILDLGV